MLTTDNQRLEGLISSLTKTVQQQVTEIESCHKQHDRDVKAIKKLDVRNQELTIMNRALRRHIRQFQPFLTDYRHYLSSYQSYQDNVVMMANRASMFSSGTTRYPWYDDGRRLEYHIFSPIPQDYGQTSPIQVQNWWDLLIADGDPVTYLPFTADEGPRYTTYVFPYWLGIPLDRSHYTGIAGNCRSGQRPIHWSAQAEKGFGAFSERAAKLWAQIMQFVSTVPPSPPMQVEAASALDDPQPSDSELD